MLARCDVHITLGFSINWLHMELKKTLDLFSLSTGDLVTKRNLYDLVQFSKVEASPYWSGTEGIIGNTPQQGINWVGQLSGFK